MIYNLPLRLTTLHFAQRLRMEGATFMSAFLLTNDTFVSGAIKFLIILAVACFVQWLNTEISRQQAGGNNAPPNRRVTGQSGEGVLLR